MDLDKLALELKEPELIVQAAETARRIALAAQAEALCRITAYNNEVRRYRTLYRILRKDCCSV